MSQVMDGGSIGLTGAVPAEIPLWQKVVNSVTSAATSIGSAYVQGQTNLQIQKMQMEQAAKLAQIQQNALVSSFGTDTTAQAIQAIQNQRILEAQQRAALADAAAGVTAPSISLGGIDTSTWMIIAGVGLVVILAMRGGKGD